MLLLYVVFQLLLIYSLKGVSAEDLGSVIAPNYTKMVNSKNDVYR